MSSTCPPAAPDGGDPRPVPGPAAESIGRVLVVGAGGNVGSAVVRGLLARGVATRAAGTDPTALARRFPDAETVRLDLTDPGTFARAVEGVAGLFLIRPPAIAAVGRTLNALLDAAASSGVRHVVFSSVTGADTNRVIPHHRVEAHLMAGPIAWTILRPGFFAQNLADAYRADIVGDDAIVLPAGRGRAAFIDARDIGEAAAAILAAPAGHHHAAYVLTGARAVDFHEVADVLSAELGRTIRYRSVSAPAYLHHVRRAGVPLAPALVQTVLHTGLRRGQAELVDPAIDALLGRAPRDLAEYVRDHRETWVTTSPGAVA